MNFARETRERTRKWNTSIQSVSVQYSVLNPRVDSAVKFQNLFRVISRVSRAILILQKRDNWRAVFSSE